MRKLHRHAQEFQRLYDYRFDEHGNFIVKWCYCPICDCVPDSILGYDQDWEDPDDIGDENDEGPRDPPP